MRVITTELTSARQQGGEAGSADRAGRLTVQVRRYARYAVRLVGGVILGTILGPPIRRGLALMSLRYLVPVALATTALGLLGLALSLTVRDLRRARSASRSWRLGG